MADRKEILKRLIHELADDTETQIADCTVQALAASSHLVAGASMLAATKIVDDEPNQVDESMQMVDMFSTYEFQAHFRMNRETFEKLCCEVAPHYYRVRTMDIGKRLMCVLWLMGNKETYKSVADRFEISKGTLHMTVKSTCKMLASLAPQYIKFPTTQMEMEKVVQGFAQKTGFPGIVGAIDGAYIKIPNTKSEHQGSFVNKNGVASIVLQAVCDSELRFLDTYTGWPGSVHDARVYRNSPVSGVISGLPDEYHVIGDSAYPLSTSLLVPYQDNGYLDHSQKKFNKAHSRSRAVVERTVKRLKNKFKRLVFLDMGKQSDMPEVISACCVLYNFVLDREYQELEDIEMEIEDDLPECINDLESYQAREKRRQIAEMLQV